MTKFEEIRAYVDENKVSPLFLGDEAEEFADCIIGLARVFNNYIVIYDEVKVLEQLAKEMTMEQALEYYDYNIAGSYVGVGTPGFLVV
jgi:hypothetical protein